jgi:hypothetical protein
MRRISLAVALVGAVAVTGCSGGTSPAPETDTGAAKGVTDSYYYVNLFRTPVGGIVSSTVAPGTGPAINCGASNVDVTPALVTTGTSTTGVTEVITICTVAAPCACSVAIPCQGQVPEVTTGTSTTGFLRVTNTCTVAASCTCSAATPCWPVQQFSYTPYVPAADSCGLNGQTQFQWGQTVTLTATPQGTNRFIGWAGDCSGTATCILTAGADKTVVAIFGP